MHCRNITPQSEEDSVADIYSDLVTPINKAMNNLGKKDISFEHFTRLKFTRKILKVSIMTKVYNVTQYGICTALSMGACSHCTAVNN